MLSSDEESLRRNAAWVIGTAVQNNPKAQLHLHNYRGEKLLLEHLSDTVGVRNKILYAVSGQIAHFESARKRFLELDGWGQVRACLDLNDGTEGFRRVAFFVTNYLAEEGTHVSDVESHSFLRRFVEILADGRYVEEQNMREKVISSWLC
jgi:hsp70-interacting protein